MNPSSKTRRGQKSRNADTSATSEEINLPVWPGIKGGRYKPFDDDDLPKIHQAVLKILENTGLSEATPSMIDRVTAAGGKFSDNGRLTFPTELVEQALAEFKRGFTLYGHSKEHQMTLQGKNVHMGSGGAAPMIVDLESGLYRESTLKDLYDAARVVDSLSNIHFFSRSMVARDMPTEQLLDINTAYVCITGTKKHVCVSATNGVNAREIAELCFEIAGSQAAFEAKPFLSFNINHVVPPMRFSADGCDVLEQAALSGIPAHANVYSQVGASSPVTFAGAVVQSVAEAIAGGVFCWLINPEAKVIFGPKPMVVDLRTGAVSGGGGEQAVVMAGAVQMMQYYDLPNVSIAGATDSKIGDAQSGYEKSLSVCLAAQAGSNLITQACGMHANLMACALENYVIDNDMLGGILRTLQPIEVNSDTLAVSAIDNVVNTEGHFMGEADTYARMKSDFLYPDIADRRTPKEWEDDGSLHTYEIARQRTREILTSHFPDHIDAETDKRLRNNFDIRLSKSSMQN